MGSGSGNSTNQFFSVGENPMVARQTIGGTRRLGLQFAIGMLLLILPMQAQAGVVGVGVTGKAGTTGLGADVTVPLVSNWLNLRGGYNFGELRPSVTEAGIKYKADVNLESVPILLDLHPFHGGFRITGGVYFNKNDMDLSSIVDANDVGLGGAPPGTNVTLNANVNWSKEFAPYLGIGWGNAADTDSTFPIGFSLDIGAFYQGSPDVVLTESTGTVSAADIAAEQAQIESDLSEFKFFPVVTVGIHISF
jgi:hypothetical protein